MNHKFIAKLGLSCLLFLPVTANAIERALTPYVSIFNRSNSGAIQIKAPRTQFVIPYSDDDGSFSPLAIEFNVISLSETPIDYRLTLPLSQHFCVVDNKDTALTLKDITIDGAPIASSLSTLPGHKGILTTGVKEKTHVMTVTYPRIERSSSSIFCYGTLGIQAEVVL